MKMEHLPPVPASTDGAASPQVFHELGVITRQLHDTLEQLGVMPQLQIATESLPDARSRLQYIARKTGDAAEKVLSLVESAKAEHAQIAQHTREMAKAIVADPVKAVAGGAVMNFVDEVEAATSRIDQHLTDIMMAQDFHDLTTQILQRVVAVAQDVESNLLAILVSAAPPEKREPATGARALQGPAVPALDVTGRVDGQQQVDDLLESLGF